MIRWTGVALLLAGCAAVPRGGPAPAEVRWRGEVRLDRDVTIPRGTRLVLDPGTVVRFAFRDDDGDGWGDASLIVEGDLVAQGTAERPVVFTSESEPAEPGQWGELRLDFGSFDLEYAVIEGSTRGIHAHFTRGRLADCVLRRNVDGTRLGESAVEVTDCLFTGHAGKAYNARLCRAVLRGNLFRGNRSGVFLFDGDDGSVIEGNVFRDNQIALRLGDFFQGTVHAPANDWGGPVPTGAEEGDGGGRVEATAAAVAAAGPRAWPRWSEAWKADTGGFVDAAPVVTDEGVYAASWSGEILRLGFLDGRVLSRRRLPDAVDASPAPGPGALAALSWDRGIHLLARETLAPLDTFAEAPSLADDHRQATPVFRAGTLFTGTWAGVVRAFRTGAGRLEPLWAFQTGGPLRADLTLAGDALLAPSQDGTLYALEAGSGRLLWRFEAGAPLLSGAAQDGRRAFLADREGVLHAVDLASGAEAWQRPLAGPVWYAPPLLSGDLLFQGDDGGRLWAVDAASGAPRWSRAVGAGIRSRPARVGDTLLAVGTAAGRLLLLDAATGLERDALSFGEAIFSSPAAASGRVVVGARDGFVRALDVEERAP